MINSRLTTPRLVILTLLAALTLPAWGQSRYTVFAGALLGSPSGFAVGAGVNFPINHTVSFEPSVAVGRSGHQGLFTADGVFHFTLHPDDEAFTPYLLGGVGLAQWGSATHGSVIGGVGAYIPIGHGVWITPEVRAGERGLARFTIGISKSF